MCDGGLLRNVVDANIVRSVEEEVDDGFCPVGAVAQQAQVTKWLLRASEFAFLLAELVGERDQQFAVSVALMLRECKDTRHIVIVCALLLLREVANDMTAGGISLTLARRR